MHLEVRIGDRLRPGDRETNPQGELRWRAAARRARKSLMDDGLLETAPGVWRLSALGRAPSSRRTEPDQTAGVTSRADRPIVLGGEFAAAATLPRVSESPRPDQSDESPEILESGGGAGATQPRERPGRPRRRRRWVLGGVGLLGTGAVVAAGFGAWWYTSTGPQPAEALPAGVLGYAAVDLDPSGAQKLAALDLLKKVPAISDELDLGGNPATVDVTGTILDAVLEAEDCDVRADGVSDWLGDRGAVAALPTDEELPAPVFVVQVTDADAARDGLTALAACGDAGSDEEVEESGFIVYHPDGKDEDAPEIGFHVDGEWAVVAEEQDTVDRLVAEREDGRWPRTRTSAGGPRRRATPASSTCTPRPRPGAWYAEEILTGFEPMVDFEAANEACPMFEALDESGSVSEEEMERLSDEWDRCYEAFEEESADAEPSPEVQEQQADLRDFEGAAVTLRFADGAVEVETAGDLSILGPQSFGRNRWRCGRAGPPRRHGRGVRRRLRVRLVGEVPRRRLDRAVRRVHRVRRRRVRGARRRPPGCDCPRTPTCSPGAPLGAGRLRLGGPGGALGLGRPRRPRAGLRVSGDPDPLAELLGRVRPTCPRTAASSSTAAPRPTRSPSARTRPGGTVSSRTETWATATASATSSSTRTTRAWRSTSTWTPSAVGCHDSSRARRVTTEVVARNLKPFTRLGASVWEADGGDHGLVRLTTKD